MFMLCNNDNKKTNKKALNSNAAHVLGAGSALVKSENVRSSYAVWNDLRHAVSYITTSEKILVFASVRLVCVSIYVDVVYNVQGLLCVCVENGHPLFFLNVVKVDIVRYMFCSVHLSLSVSQNILRFF